MTAAEAAFACDPVARRSGGGYVARCPAHNDHSPSLSVRDGRDGRVLVRCWSGCSTASVLAAAGLGWADMCGPPRPRLTPAEQRQRRAEHRHRARLLAEARVVADRIRRLLGCELRATDRVRDIQAGAPVRWPGERDFAAWAAAELGAAVARLTAEHDALFDRLYPRHQRTERAERRAAA